MTRTDRLQWTSLTARTIASGDRRQGQLLVDDAEPHRRAWHAVHG